MSNSFLEHIRVTYFKLRIGAAVMGILLPFILALGGYLVFNLELENSMSAYFHADVPAGGEDLTPGNGLMRSWFVGILFAVGAILYLYQGFSSLENYLLNFAGGFAIGIALCPMDWPESSGFSFHGGFAVLFFLCIAAVCIFCNKETLKHMAETDPGKKAWFKRTYWLLALAMVLSPVAAFFFTWFATGDSEKKIFFIEAFGVFAFGAYWIVKSVEIRMLTRQNATLKAKLL